MTMNIKLVEKLLTAVANTGDIYTDAPETAASVAAMKNLQTLARLLGSGVSTRFTIAKVYADDEQVGVASLDVDGTVHWEPPTDLDTSERTWSIELELGRRLPVTMYVTGECGDDEAWVVSDADALYDGLTFRAKAA